jgi:predicted outer membrane repeat protein
VPESKTININGPGANALAIDGNATTFLFRFNNGRVSVSDLTLTNGRNNNSDGGAVRMGTASRLTLTNCIISNSSTALNGGAIYVTGFNDCPLQRETTLTLNYCTLSGNSAASSGGAIANSPIAASCGRTTVTINNCTISGNSAGLEGGGIYNSSNGTLRYGLARLIVSNSTISGNSAGSGGAIRNYAGGRADPGPAEVTLNNSTISSNSGSACITNGGRLATITIDDTILKAPWNIGNRIGRITSLGYNLSSDNGSGVLTAPGDQINTDPMLGPLQDNGGPTLTHALLPGSPAIDHGLGLHSAARPRPAWLCLRPCVLWSHRYRFI